MRNLLLGLVVVGLLATPSLAIVNVEVTSDKASIAVAETATVTVKVKAPVGLGVSSLAGSVDATGTGGLTTTAASLAFAANFNRTGQFPSVAGAAGANGGWASFGSGQNTQLMNSTLAIYGNNTQVALASYTVTGALAGDVTLTFAKAEVGGFLLVSTDKDETLGTNVAVTITVTGGPTHPCWGDFDENGIVNGDDEALLGWAWGATPTSENWWAPVDQDHNNVIDADDYAVMAYGWLNCFPGE